jgi:hypothetical protein
MTEHWKSLIAIYLAAIACALAAASMKADDFKSAAARADLRIAVMEVKEQTKGITGMRKIRNDQHMRGKKLERAVLLLTIALAVASPALISSAVGAWFLMSVSLLSIGSAGWFASAAFV